MKTINGCYINDIGEETKDLCLDLPFRVSIGHRLYRNYRFILNNDPNVCNLYIVKLYVQYLQQGKKSVDLVNSIFNRLENLNFNNSKDFIIFLLQEEADSSFNTFIFDTIKIVRPEFDMSGIYFADEQLNEDMRSSPTLKHLNFISQSDLSEPSKIIHDNTKKDKIFLSMNRRIKAHRIMLVGKLIEEQLIDKSLVSFFPNCEGDNVLDAIKHRCIYLSDQQKENYSNWLNKEFVLDSDRETINNNYQSRSSDSLRNLFKRSYFSVICETRFNEPEISITEKTYNAIAHKHPFIIVGNPYFLKYLRTLGYKTFHPFINEKYDEITDHKQRLNAIISELKRLASLSKKDLDILLTTITPIIEHNHRIHNKNFEYIDNKATTLFPFINSFALNSDPNEKVKRSRESGGILKIRKP